METFLGLLLLATPIAFIAVYSEREYGLRLSDNFAKWRLGKIVAVGIVATYCIYAVTSNVAIYLLYFDDWILYFVNPGLALSLIVYSKPTSGFLENYNSVNVDIYEDMAFVIGYALLLYTICVVWLYTFV